MPRVLQMRAQPLEPLRFVERVDLVGGDDDRLVGEPLARRVTSGEELQLARDDLVVVHRIPSARRRDVDDMHQHLGAFEMAQEPRAEAVPGVRALDQPGDVRDDERPISREADDAEIRRQRRERVVGDLRPRRRDARDHRRLAGVRIADEPDVRQQLEVEPQVLLFAGQPGLELARCAVGGGGVSRVAVPAEAALARSAPAGLRSVRSATCTMLVFLLLVDDRADRDLEIDVGAVLPARDWSLRRAAAAGFERSSGNGS